mmetsp:Transcript_32865/g.59525  ORF Transcript_32865/g.59525 Transcript_32865/m.59525 type:complete len:222 (+) Transcript_32865:195-860(+)
MYDMRVHFLSTTSRTGRPSGSMRLEPTASITSSNGLLSQEYTNRFVLGIPMPPAKICQVGVSIVTWHAVHARSKSPSCTPASSPLLPMPTSSTLIAPGNSSLSPRIIPRGNDAEHTSILDKTFFIRGAKSTRSTTVLPSPLRMGTSAEYLMRTFSSLDMISRSFCSSSSSTFFFSCSNEATSARIRSASSWKRRASSSLLDAKQQVLSLQIVRDVGSNDSP